MTVPHSRLENYAETHSEHAGYSVHILTGSPTMKFKGLSWDCIKGRQGKQRKRQGEGSADTGIRTGTSVEEPQPPSEPLGKGSLEVRILPNKDDEHYLYQSSLSWKGMKDEEVEREHAEDPDNQKRPWFQAWGEHIFNVPSVLVFTVLNRIAIPNIWTILV